MSNKIMADLGTTIGSEFKSHRVRIENLESGKVDKGTMFYTNSRTITDNYTIYTGQNSMSIGPTINFAPGVMVTLQNDSIWTIIGGYK
jgi:hypothetical protein